jgi:hypothetical protein
MQWYADEAAHPPTHDRARKSVRFTILAESLPGVNERFHQADAEKYDHYA